jgi:D-alanine-D-alanine ligase
VIGRESRIGVLMGGRSAGREASLSAGSRVLRCLLARGLRAEGVDLTDPRRILDLRLDAAFIALAGGEGEDGWVQALLEMCQIPYTGAGVLTSALCSNRIQSKRILGHAGVPTPRFVPLSPLEGAHMDLDQVHSRLEFPLFVRGTHSCVAAGGHLVRDEAQFLDAVTRLKRSGAELLAEEPVAGRRLAVGLLGGEVLPPLESRRSPLDPRSILDEAASAEERLFPARLDPVHDAAVRRVAGRALDALGCAALGQVEIQLDDAGIAWVLRVRTLPLCLEGGLLEVQAAAAGYRLDELVLRVLETASLQSTPSTTLGGARLDSCRVAASPITTGGAQGETQAAAGERTSGQS